jgi:monovalent cation/proton antiporter MnhG/PhaG subunit
MRTFAVDALLSLLVLSELICVVGIFASATVYDRLHYSGATTALAPFFALVAIALRQPHPYTNPVWNALFTAVTLFVLNNVLSHAIARVARQRDTGDVAL